MYLNGYAPGLLLSGQRNFGNQGFPAAFHLPTEQATDNQLGIRLPTIQPTATPEFRCPDNAFRQLFHTGSQVSRAAKFAAHARRLVLDFGRQRNWPSREHGFRYELKTKCP